MSIILFDTKKSIVILPNYDYAHSFQFLDGKPKTQRVK